MAGCSKSLNKLKRLCIFLLAIIVPGILLLKGIYGSFIFTFSISLLWQAGLLARPVSSLGLRRESLRASIITGVISGIVLALISGAILKFSGITGFSFTDNHKIYFAFRQWEINFPLQQETGYRLLTMSNTLGGALLYLLFCLFITGLGEEIFWRGFIQRKISNYFSKDASIWLSALLFSLAHFYLLVILPVKAAILFLMAIAIAGAFWGYLFEHFNNIWGAAISHGIVAFGIWKYFFLRGTGL